MQEVNEWGFRGRNEEVWNVSDVSFVSFVRHQPRLNLRKTCFTITQNEQHEAIKQAVNETLPSYI